MNTASRRSHESRATANPRPAAAEHHRDETDEERRRQQVASSADVERVTELLGRAPRADFEVVVRSESGEPAVIRNAPLLADGTPMPIDHIGRYKIEAELGKGAGDEE